MATISAVRNPPPRKSPPRNQLLAALSAADFALLQPHLRDVTLELLKDLERPNRRIEAAYFPSTGFASVVGVQSDLAQIEIGLIGREGMSGSAIVLGGDQSPHATYMQMAGEGQRIAAADLRQAMAASESLRALFLKFVQVFMVQTAHTAVTNARSNVDQRLARWILMAHDRSRGPTLVLTHEFLALMLGVRRAGVTEAVQSLRRRKLIGTGRNQITVLDRHGVEQVAGSAYGIPEKEYRRLIG
jgi:CRP-like cAMP-binding protein